MILWDFDALRNELKDFRTEVSDELRDLRAEVHVELRAISARLDTLFEHLVDLQHQLSEHPHDE